MHWKKGCEAWILTSFHPNSPFQKVTKMWPSHGSLGWSSTASSSGAFVLLSWQRSITHRGDQEISWYGSLFREHEHKGCMTYLHVKWYKMVQNLDIENRLKKIVQGSSLIQQYDACCHCPNILISFCLKTFSSLISSFRGVSGSNFSAFPCAFFSACSKICRSSPSIEYHWMIFHPNKWLRGEKKTDGFWDFASKSQKFHGFIIHPRNFT